METRTDKLINDGNNHETCECVLPAALTHPTLRTLPAGPAQGGGRKRRVQAAAMVTVTTATTRQQTVDVTATRTQRTP